MKRILNLIFIFTCYLLVQTLNSVNASIITFESFGEQKLEIGLIQSNYFDISALFASYTDLNIISSNVEFSFVDDIDPLSSWSSTGDYQLKRLETNNLNSDWQLYYERDVNYGSSDDEYEYYYASIFGDSTYGGNVIRNDFDMVTSYDYSVFNYNVWLDDKHYYTNTYNYRFGSYGNYSLSLDLNNENLSAIGHSGLVEYKVGVYGSDAIFKSALLTLEYTGQAVSVSEPTSLGLFLIMTIGLFLRYRKEKSHF